MKRLQQRKHELEVKHSVYEAIREEEKESWTQFIEHKVRAEAEESRRQLTPQVEASRPCEIEPDCSATGEGTGRD